MELLTQKIYTPQGFTQENVFGSRRVLDIGCGNRKVPGAIGMDTIASPSVGVVHDMGRVPWPFNSKEFDVVLMNHSLEHTSDVLKTLGEAHRILKPGGRLIVQVPYFRHRDAWSDPTHKHFFTSRSLDYVLKGKKIADDYHYTSFRFQDRGFWYGWPQRSRNPLRQWIKKIIHRYPDFYDQYLSLLIPVECLTWEIEAVP
jgi:SAM-dependent methyltransferase